MSACGKGLTIYHIHQIWIYLPLNIIDWLIDWGLMPFSIIFQSYHSDHFTYSCVSWHPHTSWWKRWLVSQWLLLNNRKNVGQAGVRTHNPWIDSLRCYGQSHRGLATLNIKYGNAVQSDTYLHGTNVCACDG